MEDDKDYILYIDDDPINLEVFKDFFEDEYNVIIETSTHKAFDLINIYPFKIIVADQRMPVETGLEFIERIHPIFPEIVKIIFTAFVDNNITLQAINQGGVFKFLKKPWDTREMRQALQSGITEFNLKKENKKLLYELKQKNDELEQALIKIKEKEEKFFNIFSHSNDGIIIYKKNKLIEANNAFLKLIDIYKTDISIEEVNTYLNNKFNQLITSLSEITLNNGKSIREIEVTNKNNEKKYYQLNSKLIDFENEDAILSIVRDITELKHLDLKIIDAIVKTQEDEHITYARELHDGLGPNLSTLKMYIQWLSDKNNTINKDIITQQAIKGIDEAIIMLKEIANNLSPHILHNLGLVQAIDTFAEKIKITQGVPIIISSNLTGRINENFEIHLYRILMECINNSINHGKSKKIIIKFSKTDNNLQILYSDNGIGFDVEKVKLEKKGMGIYNMVNRVKIMCGDITIKSNPDIGTDIKINLNIPENGK
jgi:PAS domain S-box-containing protein